MQSDLAGAEHLDDSPLTAASLAVVGATGAAGGTLLRVLAERGVRLDGVRLLASQRSAGSRITVGSVELPVELASEATVAAIDVIFLAAGAAVARRLAPVIAGGGGLAIDKSSAFRADPAIPLVVPAVNGDSVTRADLILANPNCIAIPLSIVLAPLSAHFELTHITVATYQAASGGGHALTDELSAQCRAASSGAPLEHHRYPHVLHGNVVPGGWSMTGDDTEEEIKVAEETRRVLDLPHLALSVTTVRVPVAVGHSAAVWITAEQPIPVAAARELLAASSVIQIVDDPARQRYPTPRDAAGRDEVLVGRIREDSGRTGGLSLFFAADNLRRGAATNAVEVAELALSLRAQH